MVSPQALSQRKKIQNMKPGSQLILDFPSRLVPFTSQPATRATQRHYSSPRADKRRQPRDAKLVSLSQGAPAVRGGLDKTIYSWRTPEEGLRRHCLGESQILTEIQVATFTTLVRTWEPLSLQSPGHLAGSEHRDTANTPSLAQKLLHTLLICFWFFNYTGIMYLKSGFYLER